ncbi:ABC transporter permease [Hahella sp. KA22]|uniref:ABC transporter permease n=1 Tax=Hahella sp. KA22 TaxID=1628392 RepID=UPI00143DED56|nr:ABC transporter permease [Hahella sp. KA22]
MGQDQDTVSPARWSWSVDIKNSLKKTELWWDLGIFDLKLRYRRSVIGPFWITISSAIFIAALGFLWSHLFGVPVEKYIPFFAIGHIVWQYFANLLVDESNGFVQFEGHIRQCDAPMTTYLLRLWIRHSSVFIHNLVIIVCIGAIYSLNLTVASILLFIAGYLLLSLFTISFGGMLAIFCAKYRDFHQAIQTFVQVLFFATPVIWENKLPPEYSWVAELNPMYYFIELMRSPLLGRELPEYTLFVCTIACLVGVLGYLYVLRRTVAKIIYWL